MGESRWRLWCIRKYALEFAGEQSPTDYSSENKAKVKTICLTSDTTGQRTVEPVGLHDVPCVMSEHIHI